MCGIFGAVSSKNIQGVLVDGLIKLEYRGYDSAGLSVNSNDNSLKRLRCVGKVKELKKLLSKSKISGNLFGFNSTIIENDSGLRSLYILDWNAFSNNSSNVDVSNNNDSTFFPNRAFSLARDLVVSILASLAIKPLK